MRTKIFLNVKQKNKIYFYVDKLSKQIVGSFLGDDSLLVKRWLMTLCFEALERAKFNVGALAVFIQREVWVYDLNTNEINFAFDLEDLINEAIGSLQDQSKVIRINPNVSVVDERDEKEKQS